MSNDEERKIVGIANVGCATTLSPKHTLRFVFHNFEKLPCKRRKTIYTTYLPCHGYLWRLMMRPGGDTKPEVEITRISLFLECKHPANKKFEVETNFTFHLADLKTGNLSGKNIVLTTSAPARGFENIYERSSILEKGLKDKALIIDVDIEIYTKKETIWAPSKQNIPRELLKMSYSGIDTDAIFLVGGETFNAHRNILSLGAPDLRELVSNSKNEEIPINDVDPSIFRSFLNFLYTNDLPPENKFKRDARSLLRIANKFGCTQLKLHAEASLVKHNVNEENVLEMVLFADAMCCPLLKEAAENYCIANSNKVMSTSKWKEMKKSNPAVFTDLLESIHSGEHKIISSEEGAKKYSNNSISELRRKLAEKGLDVDGTREMLVKRLKQDTDK